VLIFPNSEWIKAISMKAHTTNYHNTLIAVAEDCPATQAEVPPMKGGEKSVASLQFELLIDQPYRHTSDDVMFHCYAVKQGLSAQELPAARETFFSKGQPCLRASSLTKRYGWVVHSDAEGRVALYGMETQESKDFTADPGIKVVRAMRSKR
jgi:hypothetical protein